MKASVDSPFQLDKGPLACAESQVYLSDASSFQKTSADFPSDPSKTELLTGFSASWINIQVRITGCQARQRAWWQPGHEGAAEKMKIWVKALPYHSAGESRAVLSIWAWAQMQLDAFDLFQIQEFSFFFMTWVINKYVACVWLFQCSINNH